MKIDRLSSLGGEYFGGRERWARPGLEFCLKDEQGKLSPLKETGGEQYFSSGAMPGDIFGVTTDMVMLLASLWIDAKDIDKHGMMRKTAPTTKDHLAQEVTSTEVEKPCACHFPVAVPVSSSWLGPRCLVHRGCRMKECGRRETG